MNIPQYRWLFLFLSFLAFSCVNRQADDDEPTVDATESAIEEDSTSLSPIWLYDWEADTIRHVRDSGAEKLTTGDLLRIINARYKNKNIVLDSVGLQNDTLLVHIDSAQHLTSGMGSAGAREYIAIATYTLTEASGTRYVSFDFEEGDHATPGVYGREHFKKKQ